MEHTQLIDLIASGSITSWSLTAGPISKAPERDTSTKILSLQVTIEYKDLEQSQQLEFGF